jgi:serine palmitoyltransferase
VHQELECVIADFVGQEAAIVFAMGFATNSTTIPALVSQNDLILSDSLNHASLVAGCRASGAKIKTFKHNNMNDLEEKIRQIFSERPASHYGKILIIAEGIYSMEGEICDLPRLIQIKKRYKCYLYIDEAHSIGALGASGRGVCEYWGVDPRDVDILMGTFTKSFSSVGGYICGSGALISYLRQHSFGQVYDCAICPGAAQQTISAIKWISTKHGRDLVARLHDNSNYFREELIQRGFHACGDTDSPVVPVLLYYPSKMVEFSREALKRGLATVVVGFPATSLFSNRIRFCISASHTREQLEWAISVIDELGDKFFLKYNRK